MVAGIAARPHRLRKFTLPITIFVCRQRSAHQPRVPHFRRAYSTRAIAHHNSLQIWSTTIPSSLSKRSLLEKAWTKFISGERSDLRPAYQEFCATQETWLEDYALFRALKNKFDGSYYLEWPEDLIQRKPAALAKARRELAREIDRFRFEQFLLLRQADQLKEYAHAKGVSLIGDLPFFVSPDSSDVWANPEFFLLDERRRPRFVAGVPPDYFSAQGQLWGNPVYNWDALRSTGYRWCIDRVRTLLAHVDVIRLDHFRGFAAAWHVPAGAKTAQSGEWVPGPRSQLFPRDPARTGTLAIYRRGSGHHHSGRSSCCATNFNCQAHESYSSRSMVMLIIRIFRTILSAIPWPTRARMTIRQLASGMNSCPIPRKKLYRATSIASSKTVPSSTGARRAGMVFGGSFERCAGAGCLRSRRWKPNERTWSYGRKLALARHGGDAVAQPLSNGCAN